MVLPKRIVLAVFVFMQVINLSYTCNRNTENVQVVQQFIVPVPDLDPDCFAIVGPDGQAVMNETRCAQPPAEPLLRSGQPQIEEGAPEMNVVDTETPEDMQLRLRKIFLLPLIRGAGNEMTPEQSMENPEVVELQQKTWSRRNAVEGAKDNGINGIEKMVLVPKSKIRNWKKMLEESMHMCLHPSIFDQYLLRCVPTPPEFMPGSQVGTEVPKQVGSGVKVPEVTPETFRNAVAAMVPDQTGTAVDPEVVKQTYRNAVAGAEVPMKIGSAADGLKVIIETFRNAVEPMVLEQAPAKQFLVPDQKVPEIIQRAYRNAMAATVVPEKIKEDVTAEEEMRMSGWRRQG